MSSLECNIFGVNFECTCARVYIYIYIYPLIIQKFEFLFKNSAPRTLRYKLNQIQFELMIMSWPCFMRLGSRLVAQVYQIHLVPWVQIASCFDIMLHYLRGLDKVFFLSLWFCLEWACIYSSNSHHLSIQVVLNKLCKLMGCLLIANINTQCDLAAHVVQWLPIASQGPNLIMLKRIKRNG
jgi:hypothetical protein